METTNQGTWEDRNHQCSTWTSAGVGREQADYGFGENWSEDPTVFGISVYHRKRYGWVADFFGESLELPINKSEPLAVAKESALKCAKHYLKSLWEQIPEPTPNGYKS
jgi:hypothetical protein